MKPIRLKDLKKGDYFTVVPVECAKESQVWIRGEYLRCCNKYSVYKFEDINHENFMKGEKTVYADFIF